LLALSYYNNTGTLTNQLRSKMLQVIVDEFYKQAYWMGSFELECIANKIVEVFPSETFEMYFKRRDKGRKMGGKLCDKYQNFISKLYRLEKRAEMSGL
jgi:hypothetical protein